MFERGTCKPENYKRGTVDLEGSENKMLFGTLHELWALAAHHPSRTRGSTVRYLNFQSNSAGHKTWPGVMPGHLSSSCLPFILNIPVFLCPHWLYSFIQAIGLVFGHIPVPEPEGSNHTLIKSMWFHPCLASQILIISSMSFYTL